MDNVDDKTYAALEGMLNYINKNFVSLQDNDVKKYGEHFRSVLDSLVNLMKQEDDLFKGCYQRIYYAGSYWDGLKVGKPTEFDLDFVIKLPVDYKSVTIHNNSAPPAYVQIECKKQIELLRQHPKWTSLYRPIDTWIDDNGFLLQTEFKKWIEGVLNKALNTLTKVDNNLSQLRINNSEEYLISLKKTGPAMTLNITIPGGTKLDVDLVPVIEFKHPQWPAKHVRRPMNDSQKGSWFVVPKPRKIDPNDTYWRLAFHDQERDIIDNKGPLKPVCRLLKKLRDKLGLANIASYYIKTVFLWEASKSKCVFVKNRQSYIFFYMLRKFRDSLESGRIDYFWDSRYNLLEGISDCTMSNLVGRLNNVIKNLDAKIMTNPEVLLDCLLLKNELEIFKNDNCILTSNPGKTTSESEKTKVAAANATDTYRRQTSEMSSSSTPEISSKLDQVIKISQQLMSKYDKNEKLMQNILDKVVKLEDSVKMLREENDNLRDQLSDLHAELGPSRRNRNVE